MLSWLRRLLIGEPLPTRRQRHERLPKWLALPVFASDALSSSAYATEEMLLVLWFAGASALSLSLPVAFAIIVLLAIVVFSYRQTVHAYPEGGGAFTVARENLGEIFGLTAASSLLIGYVLTVSVSIAAGVAAITSAVPALLPHRIELCLFFIAFIAIANLRGVRESGAIFAPPTYGFILSIAVLIGVGVFNYFVKGQPSASTPEPPVKPEPMTVFLVLTAFARGCAALTGTEAISNGVQAFRPPESKNAATTLAWMGVILGALFMGITWLARAYGVTPEVKVENGHVHVLETLVSRIARTVFEGSPFSFFYYAIQVATTAILVLAANTAYADFPRLSSILARAGFAPRQLANLGDRLVFNNGIIALSLLSALLIIAFRGETHALIPLYAIGVFLSFTLSQAGMVARWIRLKGSRWQLNAIINGIGSTATGIVFLVQLLVNFKHGAWMVLAAAGLLIWWMRQTHNYYSNIAKQLSMDGYKPTGPLRHRVIVLVPSLHRGVMQALNYARTLSNDIEAVHVNIDPQAPAHHRRLLKLFGRQQEPHLESLTPAVEQLRQKWKRWVPEISLIVLDSEYRSLTEPVLDYLDEIIERDKLDLVTVIIPEFVPAKWWHHLLHNQSGLLLKLALLNKPKVVVTNVRYFLRE